MLETKHAISKMVESFKVVNLSWNRTGVIIFDRDFDERAVFKMNFLVFHCIFASFMC